MESRWRIGVLMSVVLGCGSDEALVRKSTPVEASRIIGQELVGVAPSEPDATIGSVLTGSAPEIPPALSAIQFGMEAKATRLAVELARDPEVPLFERVADGTQLFGGRLPGAKGISFTVFVRDNEGVVALDLSVPSENVRQSVEAVWGPGQPGDEGSTVMWQNPARKLRAVLHPAPSEQSVIKFVKYTD